MLHQSPETESDTARPSTAAFDALYEAEFGNVYRYASVRLGRSEGEEVTSEVFHAAAMAFVDGQFAQVTPSWLMAVTRNKVIDRWRQAERRKAKRHLVWRQPNDAVEFPRHWSHSDHREQVLAALDQMTPRHRTLLILHHVDGLPVPEIAASVGASTRAVESAIRRARDSFRRHYQGADQDER